MKANIIKSLYSLGWVFMLLLTFLLAGCGPEMPSEVVDALPTGEVVIMPPVTNASTSQSPLPTPEAPTEGRPPLCEFRGQPTSELLASSGLDRFAFSDPVVVLTHTATIAIAEWLPDNQRVLITRLLREQEEERIETFNINTGEVHLYGNRQNVPAKPHWLHSKQSVVFADVEGKQLVLQIRGNPAGSDEPPFVGLSGPYIATDVEGKKILLVDKAQTQPLVFDAVQSRLESLPFSLSSLQQEVYRGAYRIAWQPHGDQIVYYDNMALYLGDVATGKFCQVDLGNDERYGKHWVLGAKWSPNGRYLAMEVTAGEIPVSFVGLRILDTVTNAVHILDMEARYTLETAWGPDSRHLITLGQIEVLDSGRPLFGLYLVDVISGKFNRILPTYTFSTGTYAYEDGGLAWSPDGKSLLTRCSIWMDSMPAIVEDRLCLIEVNLQP
ncbi:MAG: PD40 domain-containing protein [Caldilineaceae bacterium]|nr:PD40 domain-containing protein [Caldilineaceae bacterium]